ncbi:uncharacterized protein L969DRAFT_87525 [Mixia osmundae IAM 14324]|uniref:Signal peptidase subunit 3 n=1 Tax=Mixia osmundae (strain CBS 9802 / IAM 14324 / JCM 22182 / KY 12970) TaxID=764103 RepID=G7DVY9_MIXOS|nr:uncharacterized protein L969DRAFT_87525 [Mixia osmundae IAM 14324]KEI39569.1 hypothetical protein L969DRAFT_87525 [Mixia osmundae IAM 14324]GAA94749.1 hypothetical protein E5Q_01403 [Mixia osmundae IAM 14324]
MYNVVQRTNAVFGLATSVLMGLMAAIALSSFIIPVEMKPGSLKINSLNVALGRTRDGYGRASTAESEFAFARFDIQADLRPLFHWNTKQLFVYFVAEYATADHPHNEVVIWDRIIRRKQDARVNIGGAKNKYRFKEISGKFNNATATFSLQYNVMPWVGVLTTGEAGRTSAIQFPAAQGRVGYQ